MDANQRRDDFVAWASKQEKLQGSGVYAQSTINGYCRRLEIIGRRYAEKHRGTLPDNLFECADTEAIRSFYEAIHSPKERDADDYCCVDLYVRYLEAVAHTSEIDALIKEYDSVFKSFRSEEAYKWKALKCFQDNWNPEAADFSAMLDSSLSQSGNLLNGRNYFPKRMLVLFAKVNPTKTKHALVDVLFNEKIDLIERMKQFSSIVGELLLEVNTLRAAKNEDAEKNDYQDTHAMSVYLSFVYPEKYFLYRNSFYSAAVERLYNAAVEKDKYEKMIGCQRLCEKVLSRIAIACPQLLKDSDATLDSELLQADPEHHLLVQDILYYVKAYSKEFGWGPSQADYDPGISADAWIELLNDSEIATEGALITLKCFQSFADGATCIEVAKKYGRSYNFYLNGMMWLGRRVHKRTGCPLSFREDGSPRYWPIPCLGKDAKKEQSGEFVWKLRDELMEALDSMDLSNIEEIKKDGRKAKLGSNVILYGPPGCGKTYGVVALAWLVAKGEDPTLENLNALSQEDRIAAKRWYDEQLANRDTGQVAFTTFHQSYGYEEFIEGIRPVIAESDDSDSDCSNGLRYDYEDGIFKQFCERASRPIVVDKPYVFVIDEINRGNLSRIFGELITLIEPSKRVGQPDEQSAVLPYTKQPFRVPANITIIATMNTADRSIALMDTALRRRFEFIEMMPDYEVLAQFGLIDGINVSKMLKRMNDRVAVLIDREHVLGHAYFMGLAYDPSIKTLATIFKSKVIPLLQEYFYDDYEKIRLVLADNQKNDPDLQFVKEIASSSAHELFGDADVSFDEAKAYSINDKAFENPDAYVAIYG